MSSTNNTMSDTTIPGAASVTETLSRVNGFIHGCGQAALAVILHLTNGEPLSVAEVTSLIQQGVAAGQVTDPGGSTTANNLQWLASQHGLALTQGAGTAWESALNSNAGVTPVAVGVSNASAFGGSDTGVGGHWVTVLGRTASGAYQVADPNQPASLSGGLVTYTAAQFAAAKPFATLTPSGGATRGAPLSSATTTGLPNPGDLPGWIFGQVTGLGDVGQTIADIWNTIVAGLGKLLLVLIAAALLLLGLYALVNRPVTNVTVQDDGGGAA